MHQEQVRRAPADERCLSLQEALPSGIPGHLRLRPQGAPFPASCEERSLDACVDKGGLSVGFLTNLTELNLSGNVLETVSNVLSHCLSLKRLVMVGCGLGTVPAQISEIPNLEHLDISNNPVTCVEGLRCVPHHRPPSRDLLLSPVIS